ncbi:MAG: hypothetical protein AAF267_17620 [Deinococcota bacterium]
MPELDYFEPGFTLLQEPEQVADDQQLVVIDDGPQDLELCHVDAGDDDTDVIDVDWRHIRQVDNDASDAVTQAVEVYEPAFVDIGFSLAPDKPRKKKPERQRPTKQKKQPHSDYQMTQEDEETAAYWLKRVMNEPSPRQQLSASTHTETKPMTSFWAGLAAITGLSTATGRRNRSNWAQVGTWHGFGKGSSNSGEQYWDFTFKKNPNESDGLYHLRYWYTNTVAMYLGQEEWDEAAFKLWVDGLSDSQVAAFADAGGKIADGEWDEHLDEYAADLLDHTRDSIEYMFERIGDTL